MYFPELADSLEKNGQIAPILRDEDGITVDGIKREILLGREATAMSRYVPKNQPL